jgi:twitching motility protein PilT
VQAVQTGTRLGHLLAYCEEQKASDVHLRANHLASIRVDGQLAIVQREVFAPMSQEEIFQAMADNFTPEVVDAIRRRREYDLSFYFGAQRYRGNFSKQKGEQAFSLRHVPQHSSTLKQLNLPSTLSQLTDELRGIVLLTGPTAQGKSTSACALLQHINETRPARIITIEDPIEFVFEDKLAQFEQREVGIDTESFANGIRNALRQDPNIIFVGEMRDKESIFASVMAAETGHMILTTLHADSASQALSRIRMFYPNNEQQNVSELLARNLKAVVTQRLIPSTYGARIPCLEILRVDGGAQEAIAKNDLHLLDGIIEAAVGQGMHSFDQYLIELLSAGHVTRETAEHYAVHRQRLGLLMRGILTGKPILKRDRVT